MRLVVGRILGVWVATTLLGVVAQAQEPIDLGTLSGYSAGRARGINERGDVVGQAARLGVEPVEQAVLWRKHSHGRYAAEALPALPGFERGDARDFAGGRVPVGFSYLLAAGASYFRAVLWQRDPSGALVPVDLEPPPGFTDARAYSASRHGQVVGEVLNPQEQVNGVGLRHAVSWRPGHDGIETCDLGVPDGFDTSAAFDVNDAGDVVGTATRVEMDGAGGLRQRSEIVVWFRCHRHPGACDPHPFVLGGREDLPLKASPSINEHGDIVARADRVTTGQPTVSRPLAWARRGRWYRAPFELPVPAGYTDAYARDVNSRGEVVGTALVRGPDGLEAASQGVHWIFERGRWRMTLLSNPEGVAFASTEQISEKGEIVGISPTPAQGASGALLWRHARRCEHHSEHSQLTDSRSCPRDEDESSSR